tara:strand:+ start:178537 stop:179391 length:855 start_codon:yes stop_codon:yes gene_type:complete
MIKFFGYIAFIALLISSCSSEPEPKEDRVAIAKVYSKVLYEDEVFSQIPTDASAEDSNSIRNSYINTWIDRQLMVHQAELNLSEKEQDVTSKLEKYRNDLLIFSYQNQLLLQKLDTNVSATEIEVYYQENKSRFGLVDYIVKAMYLKLDSASVKNKKIRKWLMSDNDDDHEKLDAFCYMHSASFSIDEEWIYLNELLDKVPIVTYNKEQLLKNKKLIEFFDNGNLYLVRIVDYKLKDGLSPLSLEQENIKSIILNNRKLQFLENLKTDIYQKAKNKQEIEVFTP